MAEIAQSPLNMDWLSPSNVSILWKTAVPTKYLMDGEEGNTR